MLERMSEPANYLPTGMFERLRDYPKSFKDEELKELMKLGEGRTLKGTNARIPPMAYLEYERRHSPTGGNQ